MPTRFLRASCLYSAEVMGLERYFMVIEDYPSVATPKAFSDSLIQARDSERSNC